MKTTALISQNCRKAKFHVSSCWFLEQAARQKREFEDWIVRCFEYGAKNLIETAFAHQPKDIAVIGWRE